ncbi:AT-hook motif nuclear-localized protein 5 [Linum grandiflorum]
MDGREAMALSSGSNPYYLHRGPGYGGSSGYGSQTGPVHPPPPQFRNSPTPNFQIQNNASRPGSSYPVDHSNVANSSSGHGHGIDMSAPPPPPPPHPMSEQPVKKKRGRPRKYAPDGQVSLGLSPLLIKPKKSSSEGDPTSPSKRRGRPPGTGRKQRLADLGEWMNKSAGLAFAPHVIRILAGEDIVAKILSFAQQRPRAVCILSGTGTASSVTLRQPASAGPSATYEGRFQILCLSGSYLVAEDGGPLDRTGGMSASLSTPDGHVIGGAIGMLTAATLVQVVICSFVYGSTKKPERPVGRPKSDKSQRSNEKLAIAAPPDNAPPPSTTTTQEHHYTPSPMGVWPGSRSVELRNNPHTGIDLTRG